MLIFLAQISKKIDEINDFHSYGTINQSYFTEYPSAVQKQLSNEESTLFHKETSHFSNKTEWRRVKEERNMTEQQIQNNFLISSANQANPTSIIWYNVDCNDDLARKARKALDTKLENKLTSEFPEKPALHRIQRNQLYSIKQAAALFFYEDSAVGRNILANFSTIVGYQKK
uniref:Uncharacterized protein n=1 Tax=Romanomermis culicivorax TaxID=13658 RepID=A0A915IGI7_ROMCU